MTKSTFFLCLAIAVAIFAPGCRRSSDEVWNDTKSAGRHVSRGVRTLGGKHGDSRQVHSREAFAGGNGHNQQNEFIAMDEDLSPIDLQMGEGGPITQPKETPGELGSSIPGIEAFRDPALNPDLARTFKNVHFDYNSSLIKDDKSLSIISNIADFMKSHPNVYIFIEGHCDARGPAAYNLALGANRANTVRNMLIQEGVNLDNIFTISYGKERPLAEGEGEEIWRLNRRAQFKVYHR